MGKPSAKPEISGWVVSNSSDTDSFMPVVFKIWPMEEHGMVIQVVCEHIHAFIGPGEGWT